MVNKKEEKRKQMWSTMSKASFTVETACVMPLILLTVTGTLYLCFYVHNRTWLKAAACEAALSGSMEGIKEEGKVQATAEDKAKALADQGFFGGTDLRTATETGKGVKVSYDMDTVAVFDINWKLHVESAAEIVKPVEWVRRIKGAAGILGGDKE